MPRARDLVAIGTLSAGRHNAITDVQGVRVGHATIRGDRACTVTTARGVAARERDQDRKLMNRLFRAAVECAEESILDALIGAVTTTGRDGHTISALPVADTLTLLRRLQAPGLME